MGFCWHIHKIKVSADKFASHHQLTAAIQLAWLIIYAFEACSCAKWLWYRAAWNYTMFMLITLCLPARHAIAFSLLHRSTCNMHLSRRCHTSRRHNAESLCSMRAMLIGMLSCTYIPVDVAELDPRYHLVALGPDVNDGARAPHH